MRGLFSFVGLLAVLGAGYYYYSLQVAPAGNAGASLQQIDQARVRRDLLAIAQAERLYLAANGRYGTLEELRESGSPGIAPQPGSGGYRYEIETDGAVHFRAVAIPSNPESELPALTIDETMQIRR